MDLHDDLQSFMYTSGNFFSRKDLGAYMRKAFAEEIAKESAREEEYRRMEAEAAKLGAGLDQFDDIEGEAPSAAANLSAQHHGRPAAVTAAPPKPGRKPTMMGMPAVAAVPPPPPRASMPGGPPPPPPRMSAPNPPPPPAPAAAPPPPAAKASGGAALDMDWDEEELSTQIYDKPEGNLIADMPAAAPPPVAPGPQPPMGRPSLGLGNIQAVAPPAPMPSAGISTPGMPSPFSPSARSTPGMPSPFTPGGAPAPMPMPMPMPAPSPLGSPSPFDGGTAGREPTAVTRQRDPQGGRSMMPIFAAAAVLLLLVIAGGGYMLFGRSSPATIHLTTTPTDAVVYLDNQPITTSTSSPFVVPNVEPGSHLVEVRKHGFETWAMRVDLTSGQELTLPPVTLAPEGGAVAIGTGPGVIPPVPAGTGFTMDTVPTGARVFVNDVELTQHTPVTVTDLQPGTYQIRVDNGATYAPWVSQITIPAGQVVALPAAVLTLRSCTVQFTSTPSGASVTLVRGTERRSIGSTPIAADVDVSGGPWTVEMEQRGYRDYSAPLVVTPGSPTGAHDAVMEAAPRGGGSVRPPPPPPPTRTGLGTSIRVPPPSSAAPPPTPGGNGTLRINTRPASQVFVDGRLIGYTPQLHIELPAGNHTVTLVNSEFNIRETITVTIHAGQTETRSLTLTPG
jgi:serine/threonine-protein kinase